MAVWKELRCDRNGPTCYDNWGQGPAGFDSESALLKKAEKAGWKITRSRHICPKCKDLPLEVV